jgi:hypothetical protein
MKYPSGSSYEGEWENDKKCGRGTMIWKDVDEIYVGEWKNDLPHGNGEHIWGEGGGNIRGGQHSTSKSPTQYLPKSNSNIYRGAFREGVRDGEGTFFYANGSQYTGSWVNNLKDGEGTFVYTDGRIFRGLFQNDCIVNDPYSQTRSVVLLNSDYT